MDVLAFHCHGHNPLSCISCFPFELVREPMSMVPL
jgi:hypothetical protein